jgi:hypothetical protein
VTTLKTTFFMLLPITLALLAAPGCSQEQLARVDHFVADANQGAQGVAAIREGPAGELIPPDIQALLGLVGVAGTVGYGLWQRIRASGLLARNQRVTTTLRAVVDGVEAAGKKAEPTKAAIKEIMRDREVYSLANPIVDQVKTKRSSGNS